MAIGALVRFRNQIAEGGGRVALAGMQKSVEDSFLYTGLERVFALHKSVAEAVDGSATVAWASRASRASRPFFLNERRAWAGTPMLLECGFVDFALTTDYPFRFA